MKGYKPCECSVAALPCSLFHAWDAGICEVEDMSCGTLANCGTAGACMSMSSISRSSASELANSNLPVADTSPRKDMIFISPKCFSSLVVT